MVEISRLARGLLLGTNTPGEREVCDDTTEHFLRASAMMSDQWPETFPPSLLSAFQVSGSSKIDGQAVVFPCVCRGSLHSTVHAENVIGGLAAYVWIGVARNCYF